MIVIVDYEMGNLHSVKRKLDRMGVESMVSGKKEDIIRANKLILPGVGHYKKAMDNLINLGLLETLNEEVLVKLKPVLGICLGMQIMANCSEEGNCNGLGWFDADVVRFSVSDRIKYKVPHTGWNNIVKCRESILLKDIPDLAEFYFVHSYHFKIYNRSEILAETDYEYRFCSAVERNNIFGVQFHPEKSHESGMILLKNFTEF